MATNKKITELSELSDVTLANDDVFVVVDVSENATKKIRRDILASLLGVSTLTATSPLAVDQSTGDVTISTGTVPVSSGGTGATSLTDGGVLLGSGTGAVTAMGALSDGQMIVGDGSTDPVAESGATLRTSIGVGTGDSPQFTAIELGHASDTTLARSSAGVVTIEGATVRTGTVAVADGGTGATSLTDGGVLLGSGTGAVTAMSVLTDGQMIVGNGTTDPVAESGATLRTSIGVGTGDSPQFTNVTLTGELDAVTLDISGNADIDGTLEADAMTLNGTAITATATLDTGIGNNNVPKFTSGVADDDFLRVDGTAIEGRSAAEVLSDIAAAPAAGSGNIVTTGALNSGSITSGFGSIDNGSSAITTTGTVSAGALDVSGNIDVDGVTNLDAVDIDGAVQLDNTLSVGVDDTGHDVKFFGATSGKYMLWDESADSLIVNGSAKLQTNTVQIGENNNNATVTTQGTGDLILNTNNGTNSGNITILDGANGNISVTPNGTGNVALGNFIFNADQSVGSGQDNYILTYDHASTSISLEAGATGAAGAGYFLGGASGAAGDTTNGLEDIFRVNSATLDNSCTIATSTNASATGPLTVSSGVTLTVSGVLAVI